MRNLIFILWSTLAYLGGPGGTTPQLEEGDPPQSKSPTTSPGMRLTYKEKSRDASKGFEVVTCTFRADGFPGAKRYSLVGQWMNGRTAEVTKGIRIDESGRVLGSDGDEIEMLLARMFPGEFVVFALISEDGSAKASVEITPFPIQAAGIGGCLLSVRPMSLKGDSFHIRGEGFNRDREIKATATSSGERADVPVKKRGDGTLNVVLFPAVVGKSGGEASFTASDSACSATVNYKWGDQMRQPAPTAGEPTAVPQEETAPPGQARKTAPITAKQSSSDKRGGWWALHEQGMSLYKDGKLAEAESSLVQSLAMVEKELGPDDSNVARVSYELASLYSSQRKFAEAEPLFKRALAVSERALGPDNAKVASILNGLATLYAAQGRYADAEPLFRRSLAIAEKAPSPNHAIVVSILTSYARLLRATRRPEEADQMEARARTIRGEPATSPGSAGAQPPGVQASDRFEDARAAYDRGDYPAALKAFRELAAQGSAPAQAVLGDMYMHGRGVPQDPKEGLKWYRKAADQGFAGAELNVGVSYENGLGVAKDPAEAARWYRKAAEQGDPRAQRFLGDMYAKGVGVPKDWKEAEAWYRKAAAQGEPEAAALMNVPDSLRKGAFELAQQPTAQSMMKLAMRAVDLDDEIGLVRFLMTHPMTLTLGTEKVTQENAKDVLARLEGERSSLDYPMVRMGTEAAAGVYTLGEPAKDKCKVFRDRPLQYPVKVSVVQTKNAVQLNGEGIDGCGYVLGNLLVLKAQACGGTSPSKLLGVVNDTGIEDLTYIYDRTGNTSCKLGSLTRLLGPK